MNRGVRQPKASDERRTGARSPTRRCAGRLRYPRDATWRRPVAYFVRVIAANEDVRVSDRGSRHWDPHTFRRAYGESNGPIPIPRRVSAHVRKRRRRRQRRCDCCDTPQQRGRPWTRQMTLTQDPDGPLKMYEGVIWIGDNPGTRVTIWARSGTEAGQKLREEYGEGHPYTLGNEEDATRPRR